MSNLKNQLIKLGAERPELRNHLRPILDALRTANLSEYEPGYYMGTVNFNQALKALTRAFGDALYYDGTFYAPGDIGYMEPSEQNARTLPRDTDEGWYWFSRGPGRGNPSVSLGRGGYLGGDEDMLEKAGLL